MVPMEEDELLFSKNYEESVEQFRDSDDCGEKTPETRCSVKPIKSAQGFMQSVSDGDIKPVKCIRDASLQYKSLMYWRYIPPI